MLTFLPGANPAMTPASSSALAVSPGASPPAGLRALPALPTARPLGHLWAFRRDLLGVFLRAWQTCGDMARIRVGPRELVLLSHPRHAQHVLVEHFDHYSKDTQGQKILRRLLGSGLLTSEGPAWQKRRRIANPAFRRKMIAAFGATMAAASERLVDELLAEGGTVDVTEAMSQLTLRIAGECFFSQDISARGDRIGEALTTILDGFSRLLAAPLDNWESLPLPANLRYQHAVRELDQAARGIISARRADPQAAARQDDLLGMLLAARDPETGEGLSDDDLRDEVLTMLLAGHETTANALAWTLILLSQHPDIARKVRAEVAALVPDGAPIGADVAMRLEYTGQVISEAMRLYPPAWILARRAVKDDTIDGVTIPAGSYVFVCPYILHRHPDFWPNPEGFDPDRFQPGRPNPPAGAYLPFGGGQRKCIGSHFAVLEARVVLATLLRRLDLSLLPGSHIHPHASVTLRPEGAVRMRVLPAS